MDQRELDLLRSHASLRIQLLDSLSDEDLAFALPGNPTFGEVIRDLGEVQGDYVEAFRTLKQAWGVRPGPVGVETSVVRLQGWFADLDREMEAVLTAIPEGGFWAQQVDRGGGLQLPLAPRSTATAKPRWSATGSASSTCTRSADP